MSSSNPVHLYLDFGYALANGDYSIGDYVWYDADGEGDQDEAYLGWSVGSAGDVNGDGFSDVVVGAPNYDDGQTDEGRVTVYHGAPRVTGWMLADHLGFEGGEILASSWGITPAAGEETLQTTATPEAVAFGPFPGSVLVTTGQVVSRDTVNDFPSLKTGITDVDWGADGEGDEATYELDLQVPAWAGTLRFTTQYLTNEVPQSADPYDTDMASFRFYMNGWSVDDYPLDDAPRWERFYLITGNEPFELEPVRRAARRVATAGSEEAPPALDLTRGLEQSVFSLTKESVQ